MGNKPDLAWLDSLLGSGVRPGLARMRAILRELGQPQRACPSIIVAGTNGKGSTSATLASILRHSGYRTGLYTSPHLVDIRERWMIDGAPLSEERFAEAIDVLRAAALSSGITPTYFEALTLIAFIAFDRARCEVMVLEVGMGGRLDATNIVRPIAALITPIGIDHTEFLGNTLRKITREKAGVIHRGSLALTSNHDPLILEGLRRRAAGFGIELHEVAGTASPVPLLGDFQRDNVALAARAAQLLRPRLPRITEASIEQGIAGTTWRGRLERAVIEGKEFWIDGCHNAHAARVVGPFIAANLPRPRLLVFGIMGDKDVREVASLLVPHFDRVITTEPYPPRSEEAGSLAAVCERLGVAARAVPVPRDAFEMAVRSEERAIFVGGSLYLAGAAIEFLDEQRAAERQQ